MNPIADIRTYFKLVIGEVDSDLKPHNEIFSDENIAGNQIENRYFLEFGEMKTNRVDSTIESTIPVSVSIFKDGYNKLIENHDNTFCNAIEIQKIAMDQTRLTQGGFIKSVTGTSITPEPFTTNDNSMRFILQFEVTIHYK